MQKRDKRSKKWLKRQRKRKNFKKWHTLLCMSFFFCIFAADLVKWIRMEMKWIRKISWMLAMVLVLVACSKEDKEEVDPRDAFVGTYDYKATGNVDIYAGGVKTLSIPLNDNGTFSISKYGDENKVVIVGYNDSIRAVVNGDQLALESDTITYSYGQFNLQMMLSYENAKLVDKKLNWEADIMAMGTYESYSINGSGHVSMEATKK